MIALERTEGGDVEGAIDRLLDLPEVGFVNVRNTEAGCFVAPIDRRRAASTHRRAGFRHDGAMQPIEPRIWLGLAVALLVASIMPYWSWLGTTALILAVLALGAAAALWLNIRGEKRLVALQDAQREAMEGAPSSTNGAGTSTEPSARW